MGGAQASAGEPLWDAPRFSLSETSLEVSPAEKTFTELALIVKPDREPEPPRDGGDGEKPKRPEKRAVVSVHG